VLDDNTLWKALGGSGGIAAVIWLARQMFVQWSKQNPGIEQAGASSEIYSMIRAEMKEMKREMRLLKRQVVLLEHLCLEKGLDVHSIYKEAGLLEDMSDIEQTR